MKKTFTLFLLFISFISAFAQTEPKGFHLDKPINMAAVLAPKTPSTAIGFRSISEARTIINNIMDVVDIPQNFKVVSTTQIDNAAAVTYQNQRYILYNPSFINQLDNSANDNWASISVLAHEIGHHILGHTLDGRGSQIPKELEADEFSGLVLKRMGATLQQAQLAMQLISPDYASATHPGKNDRLTAIAKGWNSTSFQTSRDNRDVAIDYPASNNKTNYPNPNYPSGRDGQSYPTDNRRSSYPNSYPNNYPTYPQSGNDRRTYPASNYPGNYPQQDTRGSVGSQRYPGQRSNTSNEAIIYDVKFNRGNGEQYFVTSANNVVQYKGNRLYVVAKIANTNRSAYPYIIYDDQQQLYVDRRGSIVNEYGRNVGYITQHM
jgi:hypothetical protein